MKRRRGEKKAVWAAALTVSFLAAAAVCFPVWVQNRLADDEKEHLLKDYLEQEDPEKTGEPDGTERNESTDSEMDPKQSRSPDPLLRQFDFEGLQEVNPKIVGWIYVPGTQIDYPVCRGTDDSYYLTHTAENRENALGAIFVPSATDEKLSDAHVLFYGHNMKSGKMFGDLSSYYEESFRKEYPYVYVYTPETSSRCIVYSVFQTDAAGSAFTIGYQFGTEQYENWQEDTVQTSIYDCGYLPNSRQQIFTLSTCTDSGMEQDRLVVHCAVLTE